MLDHFDPDKFLVKITPLNPTYQAAEHGLTSYINPNNQSQDYPIVDALRAGGYQIIMAIGEVEENYIGSNCGQYVRKHLEAVDLQIEGYTYKVDHLT